MLMAQQAKNADHVSIDPFVCFCLQLVTAEEPSMMSLLEQ
jgi:hypothetical protein